jgi:hypothetical protein
MGTGQCALFAALLGAMLGALNTPAALLVAGGVLMR